MSHREAIVRFVREECAGNVKHAAARIGVSVSYILYIAPELRTDAQAAFDAREHKYIEPDGSVRGRREA